jgi:hypothetical protein
VPRTAIAQQTITSAGLAPTYEAANVDGNSFSLVQGRIFHVKNGSAAAVTVTFPTPQTVDGLDVAERAVSVPAAGERFVSLGTAGAYRQTGGVAHVDYSAVTSVTVAVFDVV